MRVTSIYAVAILAAVSGVAASQANGNGLDARDAAPAAFDGEFYDSLSARDIEDLYAELYARGFKDKLRNAGKKVKNFLTGKKSSRGGYSALPDTSQEEKQATNPQLQDLGGTLGKKGRKGKRDLEDVLIDTLYIRDLLDLDDEYY